MFVEIEHFKIDRVYVLNQGSSITGVLLILMSGGGGGGGGWDPASFLFSLPLDGNN